MRMPPQLAVPSSSLAVTDEVRKLLRAAGVRGQIPTPKSRLLLSYLFHLSLAQNPFGFEEQDGDQDQKGDGVAIG